MTNTTLDDRLRDLVPKTLAMLVRRFGDFAACEDAVQEALLAAATQWRREGIPENPQGWLLTVAARRRIELYRNEVARRRREERVALLDIAAPSGLRYEIPRASSRRSQ